MKTVKLLKSYSDDILLNQLFHDKLAPAVLGLPEFLFELVDIPGLKILDKEGQQLQ